MQADDEPTIGGRTPARPLLLALLALVVVVCGVYFRIFDASFVGMDDDINVYANPFLNPVSVDNVGRFWRHAYEGLYIPLAYTIFAGIALLARMPAETLSSINQAVTLSPAAFHVASIAFHVVNAWLCFLLALQLTRSRKLALLCSLVFAAHPLQVESVAWISELRGLSSASFALAALNGFILSRQVANPRRARNLLIASALLAIGALLCKPAAAALPLLVLIIDRVALRTPWRKSLWTASTLAVCVLPIIVLTRTVQVVDPLGASRAWQRPFIAGHSLAFYLFKTVVPTDLGLRHGRTPQWVLAHSWNYMIGAVPLGLFVFCFIRRQQRPLTWLGSLVFIAFLLPTLGLIPFAYQAQSTVADRYAYLPMVGIGLIAADTVSAIRPKRALLVGSVLAALLGVLSFNQTWYWIDNTEFLRHMIDINPQVSFAHNNLADILLKEGHVDEAIEHFNQALELDPGNAMAENNLGLTLAKLGRLEDAEPHYRKAVQLNPRYAKAYENLAAVYLQTKRFDAAIVSLQAALELQPSEAKALNDLGVAYMQSGKAAEGLDAFRRAVDAEPNNPRYRMNLGNTLRQQGYSDEAQQYLAPPQ